MYTPFGMASPSVSSTLQAWLLQRAERNHVQPNPIDISAASMPRSNEMFQSSGNHVILASLLRTDDISQHSGTGGSSSGCSSAAGLTPPTPPDELDAVRSGQHNHGSRRSSFSVSELLRKDSSQRTIPRSITAPTDQHGIIDTSSEFAQTSWPSGLLMAPYSHSLPPIIPPHSTFLRVPFPTVTAFAAGTISAFAPIPSNGLINEIPRSSLPGEAQRPFEVAQSHISAGNGSMENVDSSQDTSQSSNLMPLQLMVDAVGTDSKQSNGTNPDKTSTRASPLLDGSRMSSFDGSAASPSSTSQSSSSPNSFVKQALTTNSTCTVCGDKASGYHYGVVSCEGCKGFFRRTVQRNIENVCHKDKNCPVTRTTRNRCPSCRFSKCLEMGMCKESVRQDRSRKRKLRSEEEERQFQQTARLQQLIKTLVIAHNETMAASPLVHRLNIVEYLLNEFNNGDFVKILKFAQNVPGFGELSSHDQSIVWQCGSMEIMLLRCAFVLCCRQQSNSSTMEIDQDPGQVTSNEMYSKLAPFAQRVLRVRDSMIKLEVRNEEVALLAALCLMSSNRRGLHNIVQIESLQEPLLEALQVQVKMRENPDPFLMAKLLMMLSDIRSLTLETDVPALYPATAALALSHFAANAGNAPG